MKVLEYKKAHFHLNDKKSIEHETLQGEITFN